MAVDQLIRPSLLELPSPNGTSPDDLYSPNFISPEFMHRELNSAVAELVFPFEHHARQRVGHHPAVDEGVFRHPDELDITNPLFFLAGSARYQESRDLITQIIDYGGLVSPLESLAHPIIPLRPLPRVSFSFKTRPRNGISTPVVTLKVSTFEGGAVKMHGDFKLGDSIRKGGFDTRALHSAQELKVWRETDNVLSEAERIISYYLDNGL